MRARQFIFLLTIAFCAAPFVRAEWQKQNSGSLAWLHSVQFLDNDIGFAAGSNGTLLATVDGGSNWKKVPLPITDTVRDAHFLDRSNGWLLCDRGKTRTGINASYLLRTVDGGKTWVLVEFKNLPERLNRLFYDAGGSGYVIGEGGIMGGLPGVRDEDRYLLPTRFLMLDGAVVNSTRIILVGGGGTLLTTDDRGKWWQAPTFPDTRPEAKLNAVHFVDDQKGWVSGNGGTIFSTVDGGRSWRPQVSGTETDLFDIAFFDRETGFAVGDGGTILRTGNSGLSWTHEKSASGHRLERIGFAGKRAVAVGFGGTIVSTDLP